MQSYTIQTRRLKVDLWGVGNFWDMWVVRISKRLTQTAWDGMELPFEDMLEVGELREFLEDVLFFWKIGEAGKRRKRFTWGCISIFPGVAPYIVEISARGKWLRFALTDWQIRFLADNLQAIEDAEISLLLTVEK